MSARAEGFGFSSNFCLRSVPVADGWPKMQRRVRADSVCHELGS